MSEIRVPGDLTAAEAVATLEYLGATITHRDDGLVYGEIELSDTLCLTPWVDLHADYTGRIAHVFRRMLSLSFDEFEALRRRETSPDQYSAMVIRRLSTD